MAKPFISSCCLLLSFLLGLGATMSAQTAQWEQLPPTPELPKPDRSGIAAVNGIRIWYAVFGQGEPVVFIHGAMGSSNYWGLQVPAVARHYQVIVLDSRGQGRSTWISEPPLSFQLMASDVLAVMDELHIPKAALVGWSDGGIIGIDIAIHHPERLTKLFAFGANSDPSAIKDDIRQQPAFSEYVRRTKDEYKKLSPAPNQLKGFSEQLGRMEDTEPHFTDDQLRSIKVPTWIVDGDRDEGIKREDTDHMAALIPGAGELILPNVSHFALLQDPEQFNEALLHFLSRP
ncbi:MAG TPA: alpha/beta hydrolase [Candidatus Binatus sp.]|jgi:pimeloyl-ACP methyl ester carboxylesterase|nr:alpha/beta hydrolase [Candidatus Binatus sp.]